ncbi:PilN domain-containing protein [Marinobacter sp. ATCH36]|uniref:PilN domain-containing protein n=1 Tax=Marinobacter sp. ATCH36 TaxID=2945106 RepID=UPI0020223D1E|nr:PilN domain-containing protein [Marinobacter sp. ATCH36]
MAQSFITKILRRSGNRQRVYLEVRPDGIAWAESGGAAGFSDCSPAKRESVLGTLCNERSWVGADTTLILPLEQYQVFQLERPEGIDESELGDALKWKLKDFLDFNPSDAVSDVFPFPEDASRGRGNLENVVAARKSLVSELMALVEDCGLTLASIDIAELALRNLVPRIDPDRRGAALVHMRERFGQMIVCKDETLYLSRRLDVTSDDLRDASSQENAVQSLALEMQRSLDYYESQLGQVPPTVIRLVARDNVLPLSSMLASYVAGSVETLDWAPFGLDEPLDSRCLVAWGASLTLGGKGDEPIQQVNLYTDELRPRREKLQAGMALSVLVLALVVVVVAAGVVRYQESRLEAEAMALQQQNEQLQRSVEQLTSDVEALQPDPEVEAALERVTATLARRQRLLERVENLIATETTGFSSPLSALARQVPDGLWLTHIRLDASNGAIGLAGKAQSGRLVPVYLEQLGDEPAFTGKTFGSFRLDREEDGRWIEFRVATDADGEGAR